MYDLNIIGQKVKAASKQLANASSSLKNKALYNMADALNEHCDDIVKANALDLDAGKANGMNQGLLDRLTLNENRINDMANAIRDTASLPDPVGRVLSGSTLENGLQIRKVTVPLGVIAIIYEARPNVTSDAAALCLKSGNACILRGGKEAINSNKAIIKALQEALDKTGLDPNCIGLIEDTSREVATQLMKLNKYVDCLIPRGGAGLIKSVVQNSTVPVIETGTGNCHIYVEKSADIDMAANIVFNAKTQRISVCNAAESLLIDEDIANTALPIIYDRLKQKDVILYGCEKTCEIIPQAMPATDEDYYTEYLDYKMSVKVVKNIDEAIEHIADHSTGHSECIVTSSYEASQKFTQQVDSAVVYVNASTRFTDGGQFGLGAEIGISTQKLHARGPMGLEELTTVKYIINGNGQIR